MRTLTVFLLLCVMQLSATDWQAFTVNTQMPNVNLEDEEIAITAPVKTAKKNTQAALFMSALIPGAGQVYAKSYAKGAAFLAIEAVAWTMYSSKKKEGDDLRVEFHDYANEYWSEDAYWQWIAHHSGIEYGGSGVPSDELRNWERNNFSHGLHEEQDQQYFEMIGKYNQFKWGWSDYRDDHDISVSHASMTEEFNSEGFVSDLRHDYELMRDDHNDALKMATKFSALAMVNHILSAADAVWTTSRYNRKQSLALRVEPMQYGSEIETALTLRMNW